MAAKRGPCARRGGPSPPSWTDQEKKQSGPRTRGDVHRHVVAMPKPRYGDHMRCAVHRMHTLRWVLDRQSDPSMALFATRRTVLHTPLPRGADSVDPGNRAVCRMAHECTQEQRMFVITLKWRDPWWSNPGWWNLIISLSIAFLF